MSDSNKVIKDYRIVINGELYVYNIFKRRFELYCGSLIEKLEYEEYEREPEERDE